MIVVQEKNGEKLEIAWAFFHEQLKNLFYWNRKNDL